MNSLFQCCLGCVTFSNLVFKCPVFSLRREFLWIKNYTVTLRSKPLSTLSYYRFPKEEFPKQYYDAILALDFEASTTKQCSENFEQEIIEFPCVWIDTKSMKPIKTFHRYVKPVLHPVLDPFCTSLTGITTGMLSKQKQFSNVFEDFQEWYNKLKNSTEAKHVIFVTCGNWDLKVMLPNQCILSEMHVPNYMRHWINIKDSFAEVFGRYPRNLKEMIILLNIKKVGRLHSGIDDTLNVVNIVKELSRRGHVFIK